MKRTAYLAIRKEPHYRRQAFVDGLTKLGYTIADRPGAPAKLQDLMILWNKKRGTEEQAANLWEQRGGTVLVCENGYLQQTDKTYYAISVHGHNGSGWFPVGNEDRFEKLGFEIQPWREHVGDEILVRAQRGIGSALMASPPNWAERFAAKLRAKGAKNVRVVPHPGDKGKLASDLANLKNCRKLHIWSSAMGVRALVEGVAVEHHAPHWICGKHANRIDALRFMAHGQWRFGEIATGEPFARILDNLEAVRAAC